MALFKEEMDQYEKHLVEYNAKLFDWKKGGKKNGEPVPEKPLAPVSQRLWCSDVTIEALAVILEQAPRGILLVRDELSGWLNSFNQYKGGRGSDAAHWLSMHGAKPLLMDRKTGDKGVINIPRAAVSITGGIQPVVLKHALGSTHFDDGMAARLLLAMPPRKAKKWTDHDIPGSLECKLDDVFSRLLELEPTVSSDGDTAPVDMPLTNSGRRAFIDFYNLHNAEMVELCGDEAAAWSKLEGYAPRLALVIHCVRCAAGDTTLENNYAVDEKSVTAGVELVRWFSREALRVYAVLGESEEIRDIRRRVEVIQLKGGQVTVRDWQRTGHHKTAEDAKKELKTLIDLGLGDWKAQKPRRQGGRPSEIFILRDTCDTAKTPSSGSEDEVLSLPPEEESDDDGQWGEIE